jgi:hypothetical protein
MKKLLLLSVIALNGCSVFECIDMKFEREPKPINETVTVNLTFQEQEMSIEVKCEEYYDALCAERGNYWEIREVGSEKAGQVSSFKFNDAELGEIEISIPLCGDMLKGREIPLKHILPKINGETYWLVGTGNGDGKYQTSKYMTTTVKEEYFNLSMSINGKQLK